MYTTLYSFVRLFLFTIIIGIIAVLFIPVWVIAQNENYFIQVVYIYSDVQIKTPGESYRPIALGDELQKGTIIRTGSEGLCEIEISLIGVDNQGYSKYLFDYLRLYRHTTLRIDEYSEEGGVFTFLAGDMRITPHNPIKTDDPFQIRIEGPQFKTMIPSGQIRLGYDGETQTQYAWLIRGTAQITQGNALVNLEPREQLVSNPENQVASSQIKPAPLEALYLEETRTMEKTIVSGMGSERLETIYTESYFLDGMFYNHFNRLHPNYFEKVYYEYYTITTEGVLTISNRIDRGAITAFDTDEDKIETTRVKRFVCMFFEPGRKVSDLILYTAYGNPIYRFEYEWSTPDFPDQVWIYDKQDRLTYKLTLDSSYRILRIDYYFLDGSVTSFETEFTHSGGYNLATNPMITNEGLLRNQPPTY